MIAGVVEGGVGVVSQSVGAGWTAGFDAMAEGKSPSEAFSAAWKAATRCHAAAAMPSVASSARSASTSGLPVVSSLSP